MKIFSDPNFQQPLAQAEIPDNYVIGGKFNNQWQHNYVPFTFSVSAIDAEKKIMIFALSEELFTAIKNKMLWLGVNNDPTYVKAGVRDFIPPDDYLKQTAMSLFGGNLTATARAGLPSKNITNKQQKYAELMSFYNTLFQIDAQFGVPTQANNSIYSDLLVRYEGKKGDTECIVLAGMEYKGVEYYAPMPQMNLGGLFGGIFGNQSRQQPQGSNQFGYGNPCDGMEWGSDTRFILITPKEYEREASEVFLKFVNTYEPNANLLAQGQQMVMNKIQQRTGITQQNFETARQTQIRTQQLQQQTSQMIARNNQQISAGIMDSWDKKMASQDRMSQGFSQAIRGVDTYQTMGGQNIEASVSADHVYENKYGDIYEVSGTMSDDLVNQLNWTELNKG